MGREGEDKNGRKQFVFTSTCQSGRQTDNGSGGRRDIKIAAHSYKFDERGV